MLFTTLLSNARDERRLPRIPSERLRAPCLSGWDASAGMYGTRPRCLRFYIFFGVKCFYGILYLLLFSLNAGV